jgi:hypothetical protein
MGAGSAGARGWRDLRLLSVGLQAGLVTAAGAVTHNVTDATGACYVDDCYVAAKRRPLRYKNTTLLSCRSVTHFRCWRLTL